MPSRRRSFWSLAGLGALVVLNVVLVALLAMRPVPAFDEHALSDRATVAGTEPLEKQEPAALPTESSEEVRVAPAERLIVNADAETAWRVEKGACADPAAIERTTDGGENWEQLPLDLAPVSRMRVLGQQALFVIGGGDGCEPVYVSSSSGGSSWLTNDQYLEGSWYLLPSDKSIMATPTGVITTPCEPVELAALDAANAVVLCADSTLASTTDGGATWDGVAAAFAASAIGVADDGYVLAGTDQGCEDGAAVTVLGPDAVALDEPSCAPTDAGTLVVSGVADVLWLWADDEVYVSTDGGQSW